MPHYQPISSNSQESSRTPIPMTNLSGHVLTPNKTNASPPSHTPSNPPSKFSITPISFDDDFVPFDEDSNVHQTKQKGRHHKSATNTPNGISQTIPIDLTDDLISFPAMKPQHPNDEIQHIFSDGFFQTLQRELASCADPTQPSELKDVLFDMIPTYLQNGIILPTKPAPIESSVFDEIWT
ncbi:hypothetical protein BLNAU_3581 [Blattamonas nauphoetae]|uniref:Uncharacterized protein n=1 Tax=Blattamonas nauphoetae TaxID=2049346 RepID=A0ABQ9YCN4_9EUKA|nr:hypothetical protein BLNAU_3581 [Blattamonas nauphoetae]